MQQINVLVQTPDTADQRKLPKHNYNVTPCLNTHQHQRKVPPIHAPSSLHHSNGLQPFRMLFAHQTQ